LEATEMDATHAALILVVVVVVILLVSRARGPGKTPTWTFRIPVGRAPEVEQSHMGGLDTRVKEGEAQNIVMATSPQLQRELPGSMEWGLQAKESLAQKVLEQLLVPRSLLRDVEVQKLFEQGLAFLQRENYDQAILVFRKAVNLAHHNLYRPHAKPEIEGKIAALAHNNLASGLLAKGDVDAAIIEFREGLRLAPELASLHDGLGNALSAKGEQDAAASEFLEVARLDPNLAAIHHNFGQALAAKGDLNGAVREYRRALNLNPNLPGAQEKLRTALEKKDSNPNLP
jgi:tetratricopeptide (TPR) repeat protein